MRAARIVIIPTWHMPTEMQKDRRDLFLFKPRDARSKTAQKAGERHGWLIVSERKNALCNNRLHLP